METNQWDVATLLEEIMRESGLKEVEVYINTYIETQPIMDL